MLSENLKKLRKDNGFSQEQLAIRLNVVRQTISKWEKGLSVPDAEILTEISEVFHVSVSDLLGKDIEFSQKDDSLEQIAKELAKLNELLVIQHKKSNQFKKKLLNTIAIAVFILFLCAIYEQWNEIFYEFGKNLYHWMH